MGKTIKELESQLLQLRFEIDKLKAAEEKKKEFKSFLKKRTLRFIEDMGGIERLSKLAGDWLMNYLKR